MKYSSSLSIQYCSVKKLFNTLKYISLWYNEHTGYLPIDKLKYLKLFNDKSQGLFHGNPENPGTISVIGNVDISEKINMMFKNMQQKYPNTFLVYCKPIISSVQGCYATINTTAKLYDVDGNVIITLHSLGQYKIHHNPSVPTVIWIQFSSKPFLVQE